MALSNNHQRTISEKGRIRILEWPEHMSVEIDSAEGPPGNSPDTYGLLMDYLTGENTEHRAVVLNAAIRMFEADGIEPPGGPMAARGNGPARFDIEAGTPSAHFPQPGNPRVHLRAVPAARTVSIWFVRRPTAARIAEYTARLHTFLALLGFTPVERTLPASARLSRCGPFGLVTELSIPVTAWTAHGPIRGAMRPGRKAAPAQAASCIPSCASPMPGGFPQSAD